MLERALTDLLDMTVKCFRERDLNTAHKVEPLEQVIDELVRKIKAQHVARLKDGICSIEYGFVLDDLLTAYERVADHCSNVAVAMLEVADGNFGPHQYLTDVKSGDPEFDREFHDFYQKYPLKSDRK